MVFSLAILLPCVGVVGLERPDSVLGCSGRRWHFPPFLMCA